MDFNQPPLIAPESCAPAVLAEAPSVASLTELIEVDPFSLPADQQVQLLTSWERHMAWLEALRIDALAAVAGPGPEYLPSPHQDPTFDSVSPNEVFFVEDAVCDEVAAAIRVATSTARRRIQVARDLTYKLPATRQLLRDGVCSYAQAAAVSDECLLLEVPQAREVEAASLGRANRQTPAQTRRSVRRAIASICPPDPIVALEAEFARREVTFAAEGSVMATITATLPAPDAIAVWNALTGCALRGQRKDDSRTMAHKRADALTAWAYAALDDPAMPTLQGKKRLETQVVINWDTLIGLNDDAAEIVGYGPIPAHYARALAIESDSWRRLVSDPASGHLLDYATSTYQPPAALREYVIARDRTCQFPGCNTAGWRCDIDHIQPWTGTPTGGHTRASNLITLCRRHHRLKTHSHWQVHLVEPDPDHPNSAAETIIRWHSPRGQTRERARPQVAPPSQSPSQVETKLAVLLAA